MSGWRAVAIDSVEAVPWQGTELRWHPLRLALDARLAGLAAFSADAGQEVVEAHVEAADGRGHEEVYVVLRGAARFALDGEELAAPAGTAVRVDPEVHRHAVATEDDTLVLAIGREADFVPSASEWIERARSDPARAEAILDELRTERPDSPGLLVGEALLALRRGDEEAARAALGLFLERQPDARTALASDPDLGQLLVEPG